MDAAPQKPLPPDDSPASSDPLLLILRQLGIVLLALLPVAVIYWRSILDLINVWEIDPNYSHGYVVAPFAIMLGYLAYQRHNVRLVNDDVKRRSVIVGCIEIAGGLLLHFFASFLGTRGLFLDVIGLIFILLGIIMVLGGKRANEVYGFPVFFLIFMAPLPAFIYQKIALPLQHFASIVSVSMFELIGISAIRTGYRIDIPGEHDMLVGEACSGLRSLTAILALAFAIAYLSGRSMTYRSMLVAMAAPVAIAVNCLRVFGTGMIMMKIGPEWATGKFHEYEGMVMIGVAALLLVFVAWMMAELDDWLKERKAPAAGVEETPVKDAPQPA